MACGHSLRSQLYRGDLAEMEIDYGNLDVLPYRFLSL